jgi:glycosyltransferase involved in cell wall biosynthesis
MTDSPDRRKTVLVIAYYYAPLGSSGTFRTLKFVKYLRDRGWDAVVVSVKPECEHLEARDESLLDEVPAETVVLRTYAWQPAKILGGWLRWLRQFRSANPADTRTPAPAAASRRGLRKFTNDFLGVFGRSGWYPFAVLAGLRAMRRHRIDVIYSSGPPFSGSMAGWTLKYLTGKPLVSDFRDPWVGNSYHESRPAVAERIATSLERLTFERSDRIINVSDGLQAQAKARVDARFHARFVTIPNGFDPDDFSPDFAPRSGPELLITYTGSFYPGIRDPSHFLEALSRMRTRDRSLFDAIRVRFVGEPRWMELHREWLDSLDVMDRVTFLPFVPHREAMALLHDSDVLLMLGSIKTTDTGTLPAKLFEYLAAGRPMLALVHEGESARFVRASGIGVVANPEQPDEIVDGILELVQRLRSAQFTTSINRRLLERHNRRQLTMELAALLDSVAD